VRQIRFGNWGAYFFRHTRSGRSSVHLSFHPINRPNGERRGPLPFEDTYASSQLRAGSLSNFSAYGRLRVDVRGAFLCSGTRETGIDATSAITRLCVINRLLRGSGSGKPLTKDQGNSIDLENRKGR
jgi:hypothetical protein